MPLAKKESITRWTLVDLRDREIAWVSIEPRGKIVIQQALIGSLDSFTARELAAILVAAADEIDHNAGKVVDSDIPF
jgi:hypothetical protein